MTNMMSMTGFGRGESNGERCSWIVELRSVNHRYLDITIKSSRRFIGWEERIKKEISAYHLRGRLDVYVNFNDEGIETTRLKTDLPLAKEYLACLQELTDELSLPGAPDLAMFAANRDIITPLEDGIGAEKQEELWPSFKEALVAALNECRKMRQKEGEILVNDIFLRLTGFEKKVEAIEKNLPQIIASREDSLKERLDNLLAGVDIDPIRLAQEVAVLVDKTDVTEEIVRLSSHIQQFKNFLESDEPVGRRLDFLIQEFLREVNTIASKISNAETAHLTVGLKNDLEKMREQVQNLE